MLFAITSNAQKKSIEVEQIKDVVIVKFNKQFIELKANVLIYNPYRIKAKLKHATIDVYIKDKLIGTATEQYKIKATKKSTTEIPIYFKAKTAKMIGQVTKLLIGGEVRLQLKGEVKLRALFIPLKMKVNEEETINWKGGFE